MLALACTLAALALSTGPPPPPPPDDRDAAAALALARALETVRAESAAHLSWPEARARALATGKPLFVRVGKRPADGGAEARLTAMHCQALCAQLRPAYLTAHVETLAGDATPRFVLVLPDSSSCWAVKTWTEPPSRAQIDQARDAGRRTIKEEVQALAPLPAPCPPAALPRPGPDPKGPAPGGRKTNP